MACADTLRRYGFQDFPLPPLPRPNRTPGTSARRLRSNVVASINSLSPLPGMAESSPASKKNSTSKTSHDTRVTQRSSLPNTADGAGGGSDTSDTSDDNAVASIEAQFTTSPRHKSFRNLKVPTLVNNRSTKIQPPPPRQRVSIAHNDDGDDDDSEASTMLNTSFGSSSSHPRARAPSPTDTLITSFSLSTKRHKQAKEPWSKQQGLTFRPLPSSITHSYNTRHAATIAHGNGTPHVTKQNENLRPIKDVDRKRTRARSEELAFPPPLDLSGSAMDHDEPGSLRAKRHKSLTPDEPSRGRRTRRRSLSAQRIADERRALRTRRSASVGADVDTEDQAQGMNGGYDAHMEEGLANGAAAAGVPGLMVTPASEP